MKAIINAIKALVALVLIGIGWYSSGYGYTAVGISSMFFFIGLLLVAGGIFLLVYVIKNAED